MSQVGNPFLVGTDLMLLATIPRLCSFRRRLGSVTSRLIAEALGITVKTLQKIDAKSRK